MDRKIIDRGARALTDVLALLAGERHYGMPDLTTEAIFEQDIPPGFDTMMAELRAQLRLPTLSGKPLREDIYAAYRHDITLINEYRDGFKVLITAAVKASVVRNELTDDEKRVGKTWDYVEKQMPVMMQVPFIDLAAEIAAQPEMELLLHLKSEADLAVTRLFKVVCFWLDALTAREFIGLVRFTGADAARYHYYRPIRSERVVEKHDGIERQVGYDGSKPFGQRTEYLKKDGKLVEINHELERHDHDIIGTRIHTVPDYPDAMPDRVVGFLNEVPDIIRRHLRIVSGEIVKETVTRRTLGAEIEDTRRESTSFGSPAIVLGGVYSPIGWGVKDMLKGAVGYFREQRARPPVYRRIRWRKIATVAWNSPSWYKFLAFFGAAMLVAYYFIAATTVSYSQQAAAYKAYVEQHVGPVLNVELTQLVQGKMQTSRMSEQVLRLHRDVTVTFPRGEQFTVTGGQYERFWVVVDPKAKLEARRGTTLSVPNSMRETYYGSVDLGPVLGYPITLHVVRMDNKSVDFTYTYNN